MESDSNELVVMRQMQWERVKGEMNVLLCSWYSDPDDHINKLREVYEKFVEEVEDYDLYA